MAARRLQLAVAALLTGPVGASEGVLLARRDIKFLAGVYLATVAVGAAPSVA